MTKKMLIDATHSEETRVAVVDGNRLVDFDYESQVRKQLKGSIFLAKVTRVEPSLQAAFVNFGVNRHGFLSFSEIHPDYYRIPIADREAILAEQQREMEARLSEEEAEDSELEDEEADDSDESLDDDPEVIEPHSRNKKNEAVDIESEDEGDDHEETDIDGNIRAEGIDDESAPAEEKKNYSRGRGRQGRNRYNNRGRGGKGRGDNAMAAQSQRVEIVGGDGIEGDQPFRPSMRKNYKIQEVVKRGQIMLIQVSKEERGNKGAAVSSYLSLPGRYCVLMPNSPRGGGVSRKIANFKERKRMREILNELNVPAGMSVIMRTAGTSRTKVEIKRDLDYLMKLWDSIRELTLSSTAPALVHEEGNLIRRSIRDIYSADIEDMLVSGEEGYKFARDFMKMMIPSHAKKVKEYKDEKIPLFHRYQVESQISEIGEPVVTLPSGGYLVINPTEALISVDVNSGKSTKERHIEETAVRTNLEAAEEVARQLKLRDLGGLVVIDFIDMEDRRNNRKVENKLKEALSSDRARIQIGRISSFGLLELSRQRLNPSLTEAQHEKCVNCQGVGHIRTIDATAITAMRALEEEGIRARAGEVILYLSDVVALYILNNKRQMLAEIEKRYGFTVRVDTSQNFPQSKFLVEAGKSAEPKQDNDTPDPAEKNITNDAAEDDKDPQDNSRRRRGRRGGRRRNGHNERENNRIADEGAPASIPEDQNEPHVNEGKQQKAFENMDKDIAESEKTKSIDPAPKKSPEKKERKSPKSKPSKSGEEEYKESKETKAADNKETVKDPAKPKTRKPTAKKTNEDKAEKTKASTISPEVKIAETVATAPSNDIAPKTKDYEVVNQPPEQKKKGWWSKLTD